MPSELSGNGRLIHLKGCGDAFLGAVFAKGG